MICHRVPEIRVSLKIAAGMPIHTCVNNRGAVRSRRRAVAGWADGLATHSIGGHAMNRTRFALVLFMFMLVSAFVASASAIPSAGSLEINGGYAKSSLEAAAPFSTDSPAGTTVPR